MGSSISKKIVRLGYILYGLVLTISLLYLRFPSNAFCEYFQTSFNKIFPDCSLSIDHISISPPFGLKFVNSQISDCLGNKWKLIMDKFYLFPETVSLIHGDYKCDFSAYMYGGSLGGRIDFPKQTKGSLYTVELAIKDLNIAEKSILSDVAGHHMEGVLSGDIHLSLKDGNFQEGTGNGIINISDGYFDLRKPFMGLESVYFKSLRIEMVLNNMSLNLNGLELRSEEMLAEASGNVLLNKNFSLSNLNLKGSFEPYSDLLKSIMSSNVAKVSFKERLKEGKIPFIIQGTIRDPRIKFI